MRSSNPVLNERVFAGSATAPAYGAPTYGAPTYGDVQGDTPFAARPNAMTVEGSVYKTALLLALVIVAAAFSWRAADNGVILLPGLGVSFFLLLGLGIV